MLRARAGRETRREVWLAAERTIDLWERLERAWRDRRREWEVCARFWGSEERRVSEGTSARWVR